MAKRLPPTAEPLGNWYDFRTQLAWIYDGPLGKKYQQNEYLSHPQAAWLIRKGTVTLTLGNTRECYREGYWVFPRDKKGYQEFSPDAQILSIRFVAEWPTGEPLFDRSKSYAISAAKLPEFTRISEMLEQHVGREYPGVTVELQRMSGSPRRFFEMQRMLYDWMQAYTAAMESQGLTPHTIAKLDDRVREAVHILEKRTLNHPLRERELAILVGLSLSQLNKLFVRNLGKTPTEYWEEKRLSAARLTLLSSERSIKSIAYDLGFSSLPHFSAWVKKKLGQSPRHFRLRRR
ncbi:MAG: hypothetical protein B9S32_09240 [Verrucomicrobia bacterium Tous-C9LFEB]|nr:MAG: hypothetical protein B9S32_09240 [Verrucomicrobia bacterium Tous-C9LFEB]